ncbi:MAG TPA: hypothetical protein VGB63_14150 [Pedobacter sp.]|jgi:hypothetical protein
MRILTTLAVILLFLFGCRKDDQISTDPALKLEFSADSILFDTVFTSIGSTTQKLKVYNRSKQAIKISEIKLAGGSASNYQININGIPGINASDIELRGNDSLNIFVRVTINPNSNTLPFVVSDLLEFLTNGNSQKVILNAYGQNAVFLKDAVINTNLTWTKNLPYVIYGPVTIATGRTLTIEKGSRIYFHKNAEMVVGGTLKVDGTPQDSVLFSSDRLERIYEDERGQWKGVRFLSSSINNHINYTLIRNGIIGLQVDSMSRNSNPKLLLTNTKVLNMELMGLYGINADITGFNNIIANCGKYLIYGINGGSYNLKQNTFTNSIAQIRTNPSVLFTDGMNAQTSAKLNITLVNNIIWGNLSNEFSVEKIGSLPIVQDIHNNLIKSGSTSFSGNGNILNQNPLFKNERENLFTLLSESPASNKGADLNLDPYFNTWLSKDLNGRSRLFPSDLGSYEIF